MSFSWHKNKFAILFLICCTVYSTESRYRDKEHKRPEKSDRFYSQPAQPATQEQINLCSRRRDMKLMCYCTPDDSAYMPVNKAECWIFQNGLHQNDTTWQRFYQQKKLRHLKFLVQNTGYLDYIPTKYLEMLTNLTTLSIEYSQIQVVKGYAFASLPNLELITLTNNLIEIIDRDAFANHIFLRELNLMRNQVTEMDRYAFRNLPVLQKLYLSWNNISNLHEGVFSEMGKLEDLSLEHNLISVLTGDMFKGLGNLKTLKLTHNNLNFIGDTVFAELWSLQELELDDNRIERISERALDGLNNLKTLNLRNNALKKLDNGLLRGTPALLSINLQENFLETLTYYNFQPIMDNLVNSTSELSVSDNNFICDCRLQWIFDLRNKTRNINLKESLEEIVCTLYDDKKNNMPQGLSNIDNNDVLMMNAIRGDRPAIGSGIGGIGSSSSIVQPGTKQHRQQYRRHQQQDQHSLDLYPHHKQSNSALVAGSSISGSSSSISSGNEFGNRNRASAASMEPGHEYYVDEAPYVFDNDANDADDGTGNGNGNGNIDGLDTNNAIGIHRSRQLQQPQQHQPLQHDARGVGRVVELLKLRAETLPCPEELSDPTELPLSRESIGMDVRGTHSASSCQSIFSHWSLLCVLVWSVGGPLVGGTITLRFWS
ncbi:connectin [Eupeodes corollae]|uniref:connectin n=1 Tax=Eupeodes corollae TaxID=290404 RepID=UPI002492C61F|nr:connectin [Eupeodes corollae]XP_055914476.1 connectin [Eupeodes corollae]